MKSRKRLIVAVLGIFGIILAAVGVTYAFFSYSKTGIKDYKITSGAITFHYQEVSQGISVNDAMPMTDDQGKAQTSYFDFTITSKTLDNVDIPYYITLNRSGANMDSVMKVYLTKVDDNGNEEEVILSKVSELGIYSHNSINISQTERKIHIDRVYAGDKNYTQKYRLRMWMDINTQMLIQDNGEDIYPYNGLTYSLKVNVYSNGELINANTKDFRENVLVENIEVGNSTLTSSDNEFTVTETMPAGATSMQKTISVNTVNPDSIVTVTNLTPTSMNSKTKKLSTDKQVDLVLGTNTFNISVSSITKKTSKAYTLVINVEYPKYEVTLSGSHITFGSDSIQVPYSGNKTVSVTPATGYYLSNVTCTNDYTNNAITGLSATSNQTVTITNTGVEDGGICVFTTTPLTYTITYNTNQGTLSGTYPTTYTVESSEITLPTSTKNGYTFNGWYDNSEFNGNPITKIVAGSTGNKEFYAKFSTILYTITYNTNQGTLSGTYPTTYTIESSEISLPTPAKSGYDFNGWYDNSSFTGNTITKIAAGSTGNKEYYAKFSTILYTITYNTNQGTLSGKYPTSYTVESSTITLPEPTKTGYRFGGWYEKDDFSGSNVTTLNPSTKANKTYYAKWIGNTYSVRYNANGGTGSMSNKTFTYGEASTLTANAFTKTDYDFLGWSTSANSNTVVYTNSQSVSNLTATNGAIIDLYAVWQLNRTVWEYNTAGNRNITASGIYKIEAYGAKGGDGVCTATDRNGPETYSKTGAAGSYVAGYMHLTSGQTITIALLNGGTGINTTITKGATLTGYSGAGGKGIAISNSNGYLMVAGGGAGASCGGIYNSSYNDCANIGVTATTEYSANGTSTSGANAIQSVTTLPRSSYVYFTGGGGGGYYGGAVAGNNIGAYSGGSYINTNSIKSTQQLTAPSTTITYGGSSVTTAKVVLTIVSED